MKAKIAVLAALLLIIAVLTFSFRVPISQKQYSGGFCLDWVGAKFVDYKLHILKGQLNEYRHPVKGDCANVYNYKLYL